MSPSVRPTASLPTDLAFVRRRGVGMTGAGALLAALLLAACSRPAPAPEPVRAVRTLVVSPQVGTSAVEYSGEVKARIESRLSFRVGGKLVRRAVELGQPVKAGQLLAQLDAADLRLGQESARAGVAAAQANLFQAEADYKRYQDLRVQDFISAAELERRETTLKAARSTFEQARAQSGVQTNQTAYTHLMADVAGVVTSIDAEPGMVVSAGTPVVRIAQDGPRDVVFNVPEDRVAAMRALVGQAGLLQIKLWGQAATSRATLRELAAAADPATRTFLAKADVGQLDVRLGQTASVVISGPNVATAAAPQGAIPVPMVALAEQGGQSRVWLLDKDKMTVSAIPVEVVGSDGQQAYVGRGLTAGQEIVVAGVHALSPGQVVKRYVPSRQGQAASAEAPSIVAPMVPAASAAVAAPK